MRSLRAIKAMPTAVLFVVYMYILVKIILFKFAHVDLMFLLKQAKWAIADMGRLHYRWEMANLIPFRTITENLNSHSLYDSIQFYGNIGLFIPFGMFIPFLMNGRMHGIRLYVWVFVLSFALCLLLESIQLLCSIGMFDVDDLILNTAGGMLGCIIFHLLFGIIRPYKTAAALS
ncbi:VanZ like protein [Paenibacillus cellulosilyticus]|uniref:VanZ like protein n=1 Tax=Paenibacillus cellulosilyticus TaxID=375489 RepID=A0A2V2YYN9_9BACL|nr:VanZ family protein [Paenibacillus cellulosilyticus]PWW06536.1 VanZ like protein [Paenibacillus cellulosilyticus]QKS46127.1 VanZ family protein [Paenibacillus cellulosilyticus]